MNTPEVIENVNISEDRKLTFREKLACVVGSAPSTFHYQMMQTFLLFFYVDLMKISPAFVAGMFLVIRILDAILAPVLGAFMDRVTTPWGKYRPWFIFLGVPFAITGWLTFTDFNLSPTGSLVYAIVTYTIYSVIGAVIGVPGGAITPAITKRVDDRVSLGQIGFLFTIIGALLVSIAALPLYKILGGGDDAKGFSLLMAGAAVITIIVSLFQGLTLKERYIVERKVDEKAPSFKRMFVASFTNKTAVIAYLYLFGTVVSNGIRAAISLHFFKYFFQNEGLLAIMGIIGILPTLLGVAISGKLIKRFGIKTSVMVSVIVSLVTVPILLFIPANSIGLGIFIATSVIGAFFAGIATPAQGSMMPAAIDYTEWKTGLNLNGFMTSLSGFVQTFGTALSGSIAAGSLALIGYVPGAEQSSSTLFGLKMIMILLPAIFTAFTISILWFDLTEEKQAQIAKELAERRNNAEIKTA